MQLKLRDIEVANDDFERQARNTTSSLEDLESKYNIAIERGVILEEEVKVGEQEREALRIESQRLRDELSDLKIEADIIRDKIRNSDGTANRKRKPTTLGAGLILPESPGSDRSPATTASSPTFATPPAKSASSTASDAPTPPSPPLSESSTNAPKALATPNNTRPRLSIADSNTTPRPSHYSSKAPRHSRGPSIPVSNGRSTPSMNYRRSMARSEATPQPGLPRSGSLYQIRGLIGKMQKLEERVQSARSKLPAPVNTPPRASPRSGSAMGHSYIPASVTVRSNRKRTGGSNISGGSSLRDGQEGTPSAIPKSRLSFGMPPPTPTRATNGEGRPISRGGESRPSSRASMSSRSSISHGALNNQQAISHSRPGSSQSISGTRTPLGHYTINPASESRRPRSSLSNYGGHGHSMSVSHIEEKESEFSTPTPRRSTIHKNELGSTNLTTPTGLKKRQSGVSLIPGSSRRISSGPLQREDGDMAPPERKKKLSGVGETY